MLVVRWSRKGLAMESIRSNININRTPDAAIDLETCGDDTLTARKPYEAPAIRDGGSIRHKTLGEGMGHQDAWTTGRYGTS